MLCKVTEKCFYNGKLLNDGDEIEYTRSLKERPRYFEPLNQDKKAQGEKAES